MTDPIIPGLDAAVTVGARVLLHSEYPRALWEDLDDLDRRAYREQVRAVLTAAYHHLIEPAVKAARGDMRERCAKDAERTHAPFSALAIRALPLTDPTEPPEAV